MIYLNVGHTGLDEPSLPEWIAQSRLRAIFMVHDLIPLTHPQFCRPPELSKHRRRMDNMLAAAAGIIGNSQASLEDLAGYARARGLTMPASIAAWISGWVRPRDFDTRKLGRPYFVCVGTIEGRKNHLMLLNVWRRLVAAEGGDAPVLVIIGKRGWQAEETIAILDRLGELSGSVIELSGCEDRDLAGWIAGARALLMPSFAEGFGLPVIEAMDLGTPVLASDLPVFREIAGSIPTYIDPSNAPGWEAAIRDFTQDWQAGRAR